MATPAASTIDGPPSAQLAPRDCQHCRLVAAIACLMVLEEADDDQRRRVLRAGGGGARAARRIRDGAAAGVARAPPLWPCVLAAAHNPPTATRGRDDGHSVLVERVCRLTWLGGQPTTGTGQRLLKRAHSLAMDSFYSEHLPPTLAWHLQRGALHRLLLPATTHAATRKQAWGLLHVMSLDEAALKRVVPGSDNLLPTVDPAAYDDPHAVQFVTRLANANPAARAVLADLGVPVTLMERSGSSTATAAAVTAFIQPDAQPSLLETAVVKVGQRLPDGFLEQLFAAALARTTAAAGDPTVALIAPFAIHHLVRIAASVTAPQRSDAHVALANIAAVAARCDHPLVPSAPLTKFETPRGVRAGVGVVVPWVELCSSVARISRGTEWLQKALAANVGLLPEVWELAAMTPGAVPAPHLPGFGHLSAAPTDPAELSRIRAVGVPCALELARQFPTRAVHKLWGERGNERIARALLKLLCHDPKERLAELDDTMVVMAELDAAATRQTKTAVHDQRPTFLASLEALCRAATAVVPTVAPKTVAAIVMRVRRARERVGNPTREPLAVARPPRSQHDVLAPVVVKSAAAASITRPGATQRSQAAAAPPSRGVAAAKMLGQAHDLAPVGTLQGTRFGGR